jgi:hypothetical protein
MHNGNGNSENPLVWPLLEAIAQRHLNINTLETRASDRLDFHEVAVWQVKAALLAAYRAGQKA